MGSSKRTGVSPLLSARRLATRLARRAGVYVTKDPFAILYDEHLARMLSALRVNCVLDVGAHIGLFGSLLRRIGYGGLIVSYEPVADNFARLLENSSSDPLWRARQLALGAADDELDIQLFAGTTFHSLLAPNEYGRTQFPQKLREDRTERVRVRRLEDVLAEELRDIPEPRVFLKVDTQGYDREVIRGLGGGIDAIVATQVEMSVHPIYERVTNSYADFLSELQGLGFMLSATFPLQYAADGITLLEFDCLLCRDPTPAEHGKAASAPRVESTTGPASSGGPAS